VEDFTTAMGASPALNESARGDLYAELATGAESGWDYSARWCKVPVINVSDNNPALRTLNARAIIPVDLNSLLAGDHALVRIVHIAQINADVSQLADMYDMYTNSSTSNSTGMSMNTSLLSNASSQAAYHRMVSANFSDAVLDLNWDGDK
jgi:alpha,alpha-trehalase